jgi:CshA-type fibril repeat protein
VAGVGTFTLNTATGVVTLVADPAATQGTKTALKYRVTDIFGQTATSTLTPVIPAPPDAVDDASSGPYNTPQVIEILTNDLVTSPATLVPGSVKLCATTSTVNASCNLPFLDVPNEGRFTANANGTVTFVPLSTFKGQATPVKYVVADTTGQVTDALITVTVNNPGTPSAVNDSNVGPYDTVQAITILSNDTAGDAVLPLLSSTIKLCPVAATAPFTTTNCSLVPTQAAPLVTADGSYWLDIPTGKVYFDPLPTFTGQVTQPVRYIALDAFNQIATATITPEVTPPLLPTASPESRIVVPGSSVSFTTITGASGLAAGAVLQTSGSTATCLYTPNTTSCELDNEVVIVGEGTFRLVPATGIVTFTAASNAPAGNRTAITYRVTDILGNSATSTLTPIVPPPATMSPDQSTNNWDTNQTLTPLSNDIATSGTSFVTSSLKLCAVGESSATGSCSLSTLTVANEGIYRVEANGSVVFDPFPTFTGTATTINYQVTDSYGRTAGSTITVIVTPPALPVATAQTKVVGPGLSVAFTNVIGSSALATGAALQTGSVNGPCLIDPANNSCVASLTIAGEGTWTIDRNSGVATFASLNTITPGTKTPVTYRVTDVLGNSTTSTLTPVVPEPPVVANDEKIDAWDTNQIFSPFANDKFASVAPVVMSSLKLCGSGESLGSCTRTVLSIENEGTYTVNSDGTVTFDPLPSFFGAATPVTYEAVDIAGQRLHATITPVVIAPPLPAATTDEVLGKKGRSVVFSPWLNDFAGTAPDNFIGNIKLVPSSIRLCGLGQLAPNCTLTKLTTADGKYSVDTKTGKVTFVPRTGFTGMVTQPVWYQIANDWKGASGVGISTAQLITTIEAGALPTTGLDFSAVLLLGGLTCGAGVGLWQIGKGRRRGDYELPRWLDEVDGE